MQVRHQAFQDILEARIAALGINPMHVVRDVVDGEIFKDRDIGNSSGCRFGGCRHIDDNRQISQVVGRRQGGEE